MAGSRSSQFRAGIAPWGSAGRPQASAGCANVGGRTDAVQPTGYAAWHGPCHMTCMMVSAPDAMRPWRPVAIGSMCPWVNSVTWHLRPGDRSGAQCATRLHIVRVGMCGPSKHQLPAVYTAERGVWSHSYWSLIARPSSSRPPRPAQRGCSTSHWAAEHGDRYSHMAGYPTSRAQSRC
jgi:hypothetical protein